jgi:glucokinase
MTWSAGIDLGGTNLKAVAVTADGTVLQRMKRATHDGTTSAIDWARQGRAMIADFERSLGSGAKSVGVCAPGLAAANSRSIAHLPGKLAGLTGVDWTDALARETPVPVLNDAHAAIIGEAWIGAARGCRNVAMLTLGTGVGGAVISDGRLLRGAIGRSRTVSARPPKPLRASAHRGALAQFAVAGSGVDLRCGGFIAARPADSQRPLAGPKIVLRWAG